MNLQEVVNQLRAERDRIDQAITALEGPSARRPGRPAKTVAGSGIRRVMSAAARKRISEAMKARWASRKKGKPPTKPAKPAAKKSARRPMSPAARKKLSALMKARWAARKKQTVAA